MSDILKVGSILKLFLYLPWRDEDSDLIADYPDFESHYRDVSW